MTRLRSHLVLFLLALGAKLTVLFALRDHPLLQPSGDMDSAVYLALARSGPPPVAYYISPLYLYFLRLTGATTTVALVLQVLLGSAGVVLAYDTARRWFGTRGALLTGVLLILTGVLTFNEVTILQSALDPFLTALSLWLLTVALQSEGPASRAFAAAGAATALFALNRPNVLIFIAGLGALLVVMRRFRGALAFVAGCIVVFLPVLARNVIVAHELVLVSSHGGLNFYIGNNETADGTYHAVRGIRPTIEGQAVDAKAMAESSVGRQLSAREVSRWFYGRAFDWIRAHPVDALRLFARKLAYTVHRTDLSLNFSYDFFAYDVASPLRFLVVGPWLLVPLGFAGAATRWRERAFAAWVAFVPLYAVSVAIFFVSSRYRLPLLVALAICAAGVLHVRRVVPVLIGIAGAALALWPFALDSGRSDERTNMVASFVEDRQFDAAEQAIARWEDAHADPARLHHRAAMEFAAAGDDARAIRWYERVLRDPVAQPVLRTSALDELARLYVRTKQPASARRILAMEDAGTMSAERALKLGRLALDVEDGRDAARFLEVAVARDPRSGPAWHHLGIALLALGRNDDALRALTTAETLMPGDPANRFFLDLARRRQ